MAKPETITSYQFGADQLIRRIDVRAQDNGRSVAYLYANPDPSLHDKRLNIRAAIRLKGWGTLSDHRDNEFSLRVSGLRDGEDLVAALTADGFITSTPQVSTGAAEGEIPKGFWQHLKAHSLRISALIYTAGNFGYFKASTTRDDKRMALAFGAGDVLLGIFGGRDDARQYKQLLSKLKTHMESEGIEIPKTASIHVETSNQHQGLGEKLYGGIHRNINALKISAEIIGGFFAFRSGLNPKAGSPRNPWLISGGLVVMLGWAGALLTREKKRDPEALQHAGALQHVAAYIQEKPLRLAGYAGLTFNALNVKDALNNRNTPQGKWKLGAVGTMVAANSFYSISNKAPGGDIKSDAMISDVYTVAAQIINKQPEELRAKVIESTARFLGERPEISGTRTEIIARLQKEVELQRQNPWFEPTGLPLYQSVAHKHGLRDDSPASTENAPHAEDHSIPRTTIAANGAEHSHEVNAAAPVRA